MKKIGGSLGAEGWVVRWNEKARVEKRLDIAEAKEGGGGRRQENYRILTFRRYASG